MDEIIRDENFIMEKIYIRTATEEENCEYVLIDNDVVIKEYYGIIDFTKEVETYKNSSQNKALKQEVASLRAMLESLVGGAE